MATPSGEVPFAIDGRSLSSVEEASGAIGGPLTVETLLLVAGLAVVAVGILGILTYLYTARDTIDREIEEVEAERRAFLAFADRIEGMPVEQTASAMATPQSIQTFESSGPPVYRVADAFEETVMALPHYEETYGDDVVTQMATELDPDLVASLQGGNLTEPVRRGLQQQATDAAAKRTELLRALRSEREALEDAESRYAGVVSELQRMNEPRLGDLSYATLQSYHERLGQLDEEVESTLRDRQEGIQHTTRTLRPERESVTLQEYLYGPDWTYPVLSTGTRLERLIERAQSRVRQALWSRA